MNQPPGAPQGYGGGQGGGMPLGAIDLVSQNQGDQVRKVHARDLAAGVVTALFRLVKLATLHSLDNQAIVRQVEETVQIVGEYGARTGHNISVLFAQGSVFVAGQLLRANRGVYEGALELGEILAKVGGAEIGIMKEARAQDFYAFASALADALRHAKPPHVERPSPRIRLRAMSASALGREIVGQEKIDPTLQVARTYASAVVIMRRFFEQVRRGKYELPQRVKRVAQRLVDLSAGETPAFLGVTAARNQNHDDAGRAVNTAILALAMVRQITPDVAMLVRVAMAALLYDVARPRLAGVTGENAPLIIPHLSEQQDNEAPAGTAVVITALSRVNEPGIMRTVMTYEAHWMKRLSRLGPLYRGLRPASLQARVIHVSRAFNDLLTPAMTEAALSADQAIAKLESEMTDAADRTVMRMLVGTLGIFPVGTLVELSTGEVALVVTTPPHPSLYSQPRVRLVFDAQGGAIQRPVEIDLAATPRGEQPRHIRRVVATSDDPNAASLRALAATPLAPQMQQMPGHMQMPGQPMQQHPMHPGAPMQHGQPIAMQVPYGAPVMQQPSGSGIRPAEPIGFGAPQPQFTPTPISSGVSHEQYRAPIAPPFAPPGQAQPNLRRSQQVFETAPPAQPNLRRSQQVFESAPVPGPQQNLRRSQQVYELQEEDADYGGQDAHQPEGGFDQQYGRGPAFEVDQGAHAPEEGGQATRALAWEEAAELLNQDAETDHGGSASEAPPPDEELPPELPEEEEEEEPPAAEPDVIEIGHDGLPNIAPTAQGTFAKTPLVHLLVYMLDQKLTGSTIVTGPDGARHTIYFFSGMPSKVRTGAMVAPLDRVILDLRLLEEDVLRGTLMEISKKQILHGRHLVQKGLLERSVVLDVLRTQLLRKMTYLFELPGETTYAYYDGINLLETHAGPELTPYEPLAVIMAGIRLRANDKLVDATLERLTGRPIGLHLDTQIKRFEMHRDEQAIVDVLRTKRMTLQEIYDAGVGRQERVVRLTLYALAITRQIDLGTPGKPPVGMDVTVDSAPATQPAATRPIRLAPPQKPMERLPTHPSAVDPSTSKPMERSRTGATDVKMERSRTGATDVSKMERSRTGATDVSKMERSRTGATEAKPLERSRTGATEAKPMERSRTGSTDAGKATPKPMQRSATGAGQASPMQRSTTGAGQPKKTGFGMGFASTGGAPPSSQGPQHKPTTKLARQNTGAQAVAPPPEEELPPQSRRSGPPQSFRQPPQEIYRGQMADESDHFPRASFAPEPVVPVRQHTPMSPMQQRGPALAPPPPAPPMQRQPTPATRGAWQQPLPPEPQQAWQQPSPQQPSPQQQQQAWQQQASPMPPQVAQRAPMAPAPQPPPQQQQVFAPSFHPPPQQPSYAPPPQQSYAPPPLQQSYAPPQQPSYAPPPQQSYAPAAPSNPPMAAARSAPPIASPTTSSGAPAARPSAPQAARPQPPPQASAPPVAAARAPITSSGIAQPRPGQPKPGDPKRRAEIEAKSETMDKEDYFQMLGIQRSASPQDLQKAYFALAKTWHPDRLPGDLADLKPQVATIFARLNEAYQTLNDPAKRKDYEQTVAQGGGTAAETEEIARVVDAALEFQKAEVLLKKNDLPAAEALARRAATADPEQFDYVALLTWIQALRRGDPPPLKEGQTTTHFDDLIRTLDGILKKEPQYERALYYRGVLQKRAGRHDKAIRDFRAVAELNPKHIDAVREVRLFEMRKKSKKGGGGGDGGIFGKFFKS